MLQKMSKYYPVALELIPIILMVAAFYIVLSNYSSLPSTIPTHVNAQGVVDGWGGRSSVFVLPILNIFVYLLLSFITINLADTDDPMRFVNIPNKKHKEDLTDTQVAELCIFISRSVFTLKMLMGVLAVYSVYGIVGIAMGRVTDMGDAFYPIVGLIVATIAFLVWKVLRISNS
ncbi:MAG: DUF1648 domain-containing protein [Dehalococcoidia bacterium]|nr:DUF1648 domain-containing protein [Dehalococcoidia bacterium]